MSPPPFFLATVPPAPDDNKPAVEVQSPASQPTDEDAIYDDSAPIPGMGEPDPDTTAPQPEPGHDLEVAPTASASDDAAAAAGTGGVLAPSTRKFFITFSAGRSFLIGSDDTLDFGTYIPLITPPLRLEQTIGLHPRGGSGMAVALVFQETWLGSVGPQQFTREFASGLRFGGDIPVSQDYGIYLSPSIVTAYNLHAVRVADYDYYTGDLENQRTNRDHRMDIQFAAAAKILLADRALLSFRPVELQIVTDFSGYSIRWNVMGGIGVTF